ncbi:multidrug ABC transporter substrate-binding protein [Bacilli bacterium]|nr:multidrug ABC transporter substrate-binding protein [Bacilli bacterium]
MFKKYEFFIALRYLRDKRKEKFISITTYFSFLGIMLGVGTLIVVMSVMNGFRVQLIDKLIGKNAHLSIFLREESSHAYLDVIEWLEKDNDIKYVNPLIESPVMIISDSTATGGLVKALRSEDLTHKENFYKSLKNKDKIGEFDNTNVAIVGEQLAITLNLKIGDNIKIISPEANTTIFGIIPKMKTYRVFDKFESGMHMDDASVIFIPFKMGQLQFGYKDSASIIEIFLKNANLASEKLIEIETSLRRQGYEFGMVDWKGANADLISALNTERNVMFLILTLIIIIAVFNIITGLVMLVMDKKKQIAILKTIGVTSGSIVRIFFLCGTLVGFLGTMLGTILGYLFASNIENIRRILESFFNVNLFNPVVYYLSQLPSQVFLSDVLWVSCISMILSVLATIYPALKASKISPVDILRNE